MDKKSRENLLGLDQNITRRDFVGNHLAAAGLAALVAPAPGCSRSSHTRAISDDWTGYGGVGDYAKANGNTAAVVDDAHRIRDGLGDIGNAETTGEVFDLVIVGGGIAGLSAAYEYNKRADDYRRCLVLENHPIFGGEAKGNFFNVDGHVLEAPQGSNMTSIPTTGSVGEFWREIGLPQEVSFAETKRSGAVGSIPTDNFTSLLWAQDDLNTGYFLPEASRHGQIIINPWNDELARMPWPQHTKDTLLSWYRQNEIQTPDNFPNIKLSGDVAASDAQIYSLGLASWLDSMSYAEFIQNVMRLDKDVIAKYADPIIAVSIGGLGSDAISAYGAQRIMLPGLASPKARKDLAERGFSFPIGNGLIARKMVATMLPDAYENLSVDGVSHGETNLSALDKPGNKIRIRHKATVTNVKHIGDPDDATSVEVKYVKDGRGFRLQARSVIMASGGWVNRRVVQDAPEVLLDAYNNFNHAPILVVNVAVRHWRFLDKLGVSAARWFGGLGFHTNLRRPTTLGANSDAFDPNSPTVLTMYIHFANHGLPVAQQASMGRHSLFQSSYSDIERQVRIQLQELFGASGFDAKRDIAGIILNRWGHAYVVPEPGFYFGRNGKPAGRDVVRTGYGRIAFAHSELEGNQNWVAAYTEGTRAATQILAH